MSQPGEVNKGRSEETVMVNRVGVRVPPFYPSKPSLWFASLESQFVLAGITTDSTKYHYAISYLEPQHIEIVEDIVAAPTAPDKYEQLKTELVKRLTASREKQVHQLLHHEELGDRKPSQFLRRLKTLAGEGVPDDFLRTLWSSRLPSSVQPIIASQANMKLDDVAELADQIHDVIALSPQVAAAETPAGSSGAMDRQIAELTRQVQALSSKVDRMSRPRARSSSRSARARRTRTRSQSSYQKFPVCWYHSKFGDEANSCVKPCDYAGKAKGSR